MPVAPSGRGGPSALASPVRLPHNDQVTRPFEADLEKATYDSLLIASSESEIIGLLRRAATGLAGLMQIPTYPGEQVHLSSALAAVDLALNELEGFA
jgi:hypothetical protein